MFELFSGSDGRALIDLFIIGSSSFNSNLLFVCCIIE